MTPYRGIFGGLDLFGSLCTAEGKPPDRPEHTHTRVTPTHAPFFSRPRAECAYGGSGRRLLSLLGASPSLSGYFFPPFMPDNFIPPQVGSRRSLLFHREEKQLRWLHSGACFRVRIHRGAEGEATSGENLSFLYLCMYIHID